MADSLRQPLLNGGDVRVERQVSKKRIGQQEERGASDKAAGSADRLVRKIFTRVGDFGKTVYQEATKSAQPPKAGLAAALCSLLCFAPPPFHLFNKNGVWAVVTADVVLEANVGLTITKGLNRTLGTLAAAVLALGVNYYAVYMGWFQPFYIMFWVFSVALVATMFKFRRPFKDRWNYGVAMSMITFHILVLSKSDYKDKVVLPLIRLATIMIGFLTMSIVNMGIAPLFAGTSLNASVAKNFERAGTVMERCVACYLEDKVLDKVGDILIGQKQDDSIHKSFTEIMATDADCEKLLNAVPFEPCHGRFFYGYPWSLYRDVTDNLRYTLYDVIALDSCLRAEIQAPSELRNLCKEEFTAIGKECAEIFRLLGESMRNMQNVECGDHVREADEWVQHLQRKIAQQTQPMLGGSTKSKTGSVAPELDDGIVYSDSAFNTPAFNTPLQTPPVLKTVPPPVQSFVGQGKLAEAISEMAEERRLELKREIRTRIRALSLIKFASLLIELVAKAKYLVDLVTELGLNAGFDDVSPPRGLSFKAGSHQV